MQIPAAMVAQEVLNQGGTKEQALVAAALVSGIESNGDPTELSGGVGPAAGLFQFEPGTWVGNGGGAFAPVAQDATWQQQVTVFLNASAGNNFHDWGPDLTGQGNPNSASNPSYSYSGAPKQGSPVANKIADLMANDKALSGVIGNVPQNWADLGGTGSSLTGSAASVAGDVAKAAATPVLDIFGIAKSGLNLVDEEAHLLGVVTSSSFWQRVGMGILGVGMLAFGAVLFFSSTKTGQRAISEGEQAGGTAAMAAAAA